MTSDQTIQERVENYWTNRSISFLEQRTREFHSPLKERWITEFEKYLPQKTELKILDMYCTPKVRHEKSNFWGVFL